MKYEQELRDMVVFRKSDIQKLTGGNEHTAKTLLYRYSGHGDDNKKYHKEHIVRIRRDYYAIKDPLPEWDVIGSNVNESSCLAFHSAMAYHGLTAKTPNEIHVASKQRFAPFTFNGQEYTWIKPNTEEGIVSPGRLIRVTDVERTIVDCLSDYNKVGGFSELLRCLYSIQNIDSGRLLFYLSIYGSQFIYQKAGYLLMHFRENMNLDDRFFECCQANAGLSRRYLLGVEYSSYCYEFHPELCLYTPHDIRPFMEDTWPDTAKQRPPSERSIERERKYEMFRWYKP